MLILKAAAALGLFYLSMYISRVLTDGLRAGLRYSELAYAFAQDSLDNLVSGFEQIEVVFKKYFGIQAPVSDEFRGVPLSEDIKEEISEYFLSYGVLSSNELRLKGQKLLELCTDDLNNNKRNYNAKKSHLLL